MKTLAHIHSLNGKMEEVRIVQFNDYNHVVAEYGGNFYSAVFNPFVGAYYVDDKYGFIGKAGDLNDTKTKEHI